MKTPLRSLITLLCAAIVSLQIVQASTLTVINTSDSGPGSLRQALIDASDLDTINFAPGLNGSITLTTGQLVVNKSVNISGPGANQLTVDANHISRVFYIAPLTTGTISGLTITNGFVIGDLGGGIYNDFGTLTVNDCTISGNSSVFNDPYGGIGGGIFNAGGTLTINNSTFSGNSATYSGSGIMNYTDNGSIATLTVNNSTFSGNSDGCIQNFGNGVSAFLTINNSTLSGNSGIGISSETDNSGTAFLTINNSTLSGNSGIGIYNSPASGLGGTTMLTIGSTILNANSGGNILNYGTVNSNGYNLSSDAADGDGTTGPGGLLNATGDIRNTDPMLGALGNNGGPTFTHALLGGSPAIDKGKNFTTATTDQRGTGFTRTVDLGFPKPTGGDGTDIGAFEVQAPTVCPQGPGYWKNNPDAWPASALPMTLGSKTYTKTELLTILGTPVGKGTKADASLILAYQLIAAKLNIANGADGTPVSSTITNADMLLTGNPPYVGKLPYKVKTSTSKGQAMVNDANVLNNFNNGLLTLGCGL